MFPEVEKMAVADGERETETELRKKEMTPWEQHSAVISIPRFDYNAPSSLLQHSHSGFLITCPISLSRSLFLIYFNSLTQNPNSNTVFLSCSFQFIRAGEKRHERSNLPLRKGKLVLNWKTFDPCILQFRHDPSNLCFLLLLFFTVYSVL